MDLISLKDISNQFKINNQRKLLLIHLFMFKNRLNSEIKKIIGYNALYCNNFMKIYIR